MGKMRGGKKKTRSKKRSGKKKTRSKKGGERNLTKAQCTNKFREHKICGDNKKKSYRQWLKKNHPDRGGSTETFQTVSSCLTEHWDGDMKKLNEAKFGCDEEKTAPVKAVAEPTRMAQQAETDTSKPAANVVPTLEDGTELGYK